MAKTEANAGSELASMIAKVEQNGFRIGPISGTSPLECKLFGDAKERGANDTSRTEHSVGNSAA